MPVSRSNIDTVFSYHPPTGQPQVDAYQEIREAGKNLAEKILKHAPQCGDQQAAIRHVREAVMTANAALALSGEV